MSRTDALKRPFAVGVGLIILLFTGIGVAIKQVEAHRHRPEGVAERWLVAVSDTTRKGVTADGRSRAAKIGPGVAYAALLPKDAGDKAAFEDLQIGRAVRDGTTARVPFEAHQRNGGTLKQVVVLRHEPSGTWHVTGYAARHAGERVPSEGGSAPSKASGATWLVFGLIALAFGALCSWLVNWAGPPAPSTA